MSCLYMQVANDVYNHNFKFYSYIYVYNYIIVIKIIPFCFDNFFIRFIILAPLLIALDAFVSELLRASAVQSLLGVPT